MTNSEQIVASLIDNNRITGEEAVALLKAIYGKEKTIDNSLGKSYWKTNSDIDNTYKHTDILCTDVLCSNANTIQNDDFVSSISLSSDM